MRRRAIRIVSTGAVAFVALLVAASCRGRAEFRRGLDLEASGDLEGAYRELFDAWRLAPNTTHRTALDRVGTSVATRLVAEAGSATWSGALDDAVDRFATALDYSPDHALARDGYWRVRTTIEAWERVAEAADGEAKDRDVVAASGQAPDNAGERTASASTLDDPWLAIDGTSDAVDRLLEIAALAACPAAERSRRVELAATAIESLLEALDERTFGEPLGLDAARVRRFTSAWRALAARVDARRQDLDTQLAGAAIAPSSGWYELREVLEQGRLLAVLAASSARAQSTATRLERLLDGISRFHDARRLENQGDLLGAHDAYLEALALSPEAVEVRIARERVLERWRRQTHDAAQASIARGDWREAVRALEALCSHSAQAPEHVVGTRGVVDRLAFCRQELAREHRRAAADFEARELPGNALLGYLEVEFATPGDAEVGASLERLERTLERRVSPALVLEQDPVDEDERTLSRMLWRMDDDTIATLRGVLAKGFHRGATPPRDPSALRVVVADIDFSFVEREATRGIEHGRFLRSFALARNSERIASGLAVERAAELLEESRRAAEDAPSWSRSMANDVLELRGGSLEQARVLHHERPSEVPVVTWEERGYTVTTVALVAELAARFHAERLGIEDRWVTVRWESIDRVVDDGSLAGLALDPLDIPERDDLLANLAAALGEKLRASVDRVVDEERIRYYHAGLERLEHGALELAIENLVTFVHGARGASPTLQSKDAVRRLEMLARSDAVRAWAALPPRRTRAGG